MSICEGFSNTIAHMLYNNSISLTFNYRILDELTFAYCLFTLSDCYELVIWGYDVLFLLQCMRDMCKEEDYAFLNKKERGELDKTLKESMLHESEWQQEQEERVNTLLQSVPKTCQLFFVHVY